MKKLLNTLYVTHPDSFLSLKGENVVIYKNEDIAMRLPLHNLQNIVCFGYSGASPALMAACSERHIGICFMSPSGRFLGRVVGKVQGNVLLRKKQYLLSEDEEKSVNISISFLIGKVFNCRKVIDRAIRKSQLRWIEKYDTIHDLMGFEGSAAKIYFSVFDHLILHQKGDFYFRERSRRPPMDNLNAILSYLYTILVHEMASALETVGLDPYVGFLHQDRPGRPSLALDMIEELRPVFADRMAVSLINRKQINANGFRKKESGGILMDDETRKIVIQAWQERKKDELIHPFLGEKIQFGLIPHVQAMLLARYLRGDLDAYPPFFWS